MASVEYSKAPVAADNTSASLLDRALDFVTTYPGSHTAFTMLAVALCIAVAFLATRGGRSFRRARPWRVLKVLFSKRYLWRKTHVLDALMFIYNTRAIGATIGIFLISGPWVSYWTYQALVAQFGAREPTSLSPWTVWAIGTVVIWVVYEFAYWLDHYLCHRIPLLWEFHKVHHQAEMLSPITNFRVHPVDTAVFSNILSLTIGPADGLLCFAFGKPYASISMFGFHFMLVVAAYVVVQLQHTHVWIPFTGVWGKIFVSPAHHQIHHSNNPLHHNKNMGSCLAIFDWMFGTLHVPSKRREKLIFGAESTAADPHTLLEGLVNPFVRAWGHVRSWFGQHDNGPSGKPTPMPPAAMPEPRAA